MKGDRFMGINSTSHFLRKSYHYLDTQTALEMVYIMELSTVEKMEKMEPLEYDSREISLFELPKEIAKRVLNDKKFRVEHPLSPKQLQEIRDRDIDLFSISEEDLE
jgi:hypothetical protein